MTGPKRCSGPRLEKLRRSLPDAGSFRPEVAKNVLACPLSAALSDGGDRAAQQEIATPLCRGS